MHDEVGLQRSATARRRAAPEMKNLLGGKGANLAEMSNLGLPVPPGFTITTEVCTYYYANGETYPADLKDAGRRALAQGRRSGERHASAIPTSRCWSRCVRARASPCPA